MKALVVKNFTIYVYSSWVEFYENLRNQEDYHKPTRAWDCFFLKQGQGYRRDQTVAFPRTPGLKLVVRKGPSSKGARLEDQAV